MPRGALQFGGHKASTRAALFLVVMLVLAACSSDPVVPRPEFEAPRPTTTSTTTVAVTTTIPSEILDLINGVGMTEEARAVFLASDPKIEDAATFARSCDDLSTTGEDRAHTHGCFVNGKIHMRAVGAKEIADLIYVVAAHELLHAVYARLSGPDRFTLNAELESLREALPLLRERLKAYSAAGPIGAETHSLAGSEFGDLPAPLESRFTRYFDREKVLRAFRRALGDREQEIRRVRFSVTDLDAEIGRMRIQLQAYEAAGDVDAYNTAVEPYNALVVERNRQAQTLNDQIQAYNRLISA